MQKQAAQNSAAWQDQARWSRQQQPQQPPCHKKYAAAAGAEEPSSELADTHNQEPGKQTRFADVEGNPLTEEENQDSLEYVTKQKKDPKNETKESEGECRLVQPVVARGSVKRLWDEGSADESRSKTSSAARPLEDHHTKPTRPGQLAQRKGRGKQRVVPASQAGLRRRVAPHKHTPPCYKALWDSFVSFGRNCDVKFNNVNVIYQMGADFLIKGQLAEGGRKIDTVTASHHFAAALRRFAPEVLWSALVKHAGQEALGCTLATAEGPRSLTPARAKEPLSWEACCLLIRQLCRDGNREMGLAVAMTHALRLRAWRLLDCTIGQLTPPLQNDPRTHQCCCLALHPGEQARRHKIGMRDGSMLIEGVFFLLLTPVLHRWLDGRNSNEMLFRFTCEQWSHAFKAAGESCGLGCLGPLTLQQLRHGWAKSNAEGRVRQLWQLEPKIRWRCLAAARSIGETLSGTSSTTSVAMVL